MKKNKIIQEIQQLNRKYKDSGFEVDLIPANSKNVLIQEALKGEQLFI